MADERDGSDDGLHEEELPVDEGGVGPKLQHIETKSGEENYNEVCKIKAKIWRFDEGENIWKERGQGDARVLNAKTDKKKYVFVFRRDGVGKIAAFHAIVPGMKLKTAQNNDKMLTWMTMKDYTDDDEGFPEMFTIKFSSRDLADDFKRHFDAAIEAQQ